MARLMQVRSPDLLVQHTDLLQPSLCLPALHLHASVCLRYPSCRAICKSTRLRSSPLKVHTTHLTGTPWRGSGWQAMNIAREKLARLPDGKKLKVYPGKPTEGREK